MPRPCIALITFALLAAAPVFAGEAEIKAALELGKKLAGVQKLTELSFRPYLMADEEVRKELFKHYDALPFNEDNRAIFAMAVIRNDKSEDARQAAAGWLVKLKTNKTAIAKLGDLLADKNPAIRATAAEGLIGYRGDPTLGPKFAKLLTDDSPALRSAAVRALGKLGDRKQVPQIIAAYKKFKKGTDDDAPYAEALAALGETDVSLEIAKVCIKSRHQPLRVMAVYALESNPSMKVVPVLMDNLVLELGRTLRLDSTKEDWDIVYVTMCSELVRRTGKNFDNDVVGWYRWWSGVREEYGAAAPAFDEAIASRWLDAYRKMNPSKVKQ